MQGGQGARARRYSKLHPDILFQTLAFWEKVLVLFVREVVEKPSYNMSITIYDNLSVE